MSKRPFNKIRRIEKKENIDEAQENKEEFKIEQNNDRENSNKPPKLSLDKKKIKIGPSQAPKPSEEASDRDKPSTLGSKPNLFKGKRDAGKPPIISSNRNTVNSQHIAQQSYPQAPKPTPLVIKKRLNFQPKNKQRENIVIQQEESYQRLQAEESQTLNVDDSVTFKRRPDLKIKKYLEKRQFSDKDNQFQQSVANKIGYTPNQYPNQHKEEPFASNNIQYREINIQPTTAAVSEGKLDKQKKRTAELKNLLNFQLDLYEPTLSISSVTPYEIYINKIKGGFLKNSNDQAFDDKTTDSCQTLSLQYSEFTNQCPQDYSVEISKISNIDSDVLFEQFILKVAPIIEQLIKPVQSVTQPPIFLLAFRPVFKTFIKCPYPLFIYRSQEYNLDLIIVGEKLYISEGQICSVLMIGKNIIAGLKNGYLVYWNGENNKSSRLYQQIKEFTQSTNFQLPFFSTSHIDRFSSYLSDFSIVSLLQTAGNEFMSMDSTGKIVRWAIQETAGGSQELRPLSVIQLKSLSQHWAIQAYSLKQRGQSLYASTSLGIACLQNQQVKQKLDCHGYKVTAFQIPKKSPLVYVITQNNSLLIFNELYSKHLFQLQIFTGSQMLKQIIIPQIQHDNRQLAYLFVLYLVDTSGKIYEIKILQNKCEPLKILGQDEESQNRKNKSIIFKGVARIGQILQTVKLTRDLKITTSLWKMNIVTDKTIPNLKSIIEKNRELMTVLEGESTIIV